MVNWEEMLDPLGKYYILLKENTSTYYQRKNFLKKLMPPYVDQPNSFFNADIGALYGRAPDERQPSNKSLVGLVSIEKSDNYIYSLDVQLSDVIEINFKELKLLLAVSSNNERLATVMNTCQFKRAYQAEAGDIVLVKMNFRDQKDDMKYGVIKRIQHNGKGNGHYFYVSFKGNDDRDESKWQRYAVNHLFFPNKRNPVILDTKKYYVLKEEQCCSVFDEEKAIEIVVLERGIILTECDAGKQPVNKNTMCLSLFDQKDFILETTCNKLFDISYAEATFLVAIDNPGERLRALENREQLEYTIHAKIGDLVHIDGKEKRIVDIGSTREKTGNYFHLSYADPQHAAGIDQPVVPFNRVQFIKEAPENFKSGLEKVEKWVQVDNKDDGKYERQPSKEVDHHDTKKEKNYRLRDIIGKRAFVPEQEICGTVKFVGKPAGGSKLLYGIETDEQLPRSNGNYYEGKKLFNCKPNHGIILETKKVIIEDCTDPEFGKEANNHKDKAISKLPTKRREKYQKLRNSGLEVANWEETLNPIEKYYILIKDSTGERYEKKNFLKKLIPPYVDQPNSFFNADIGTLYERAPDERQPSNKSVVGLVSIEKSDNYIYSLDVQLSDVIEINFKELKLLLAVSSNNERLATVMNTCQFKRAYQAEAGDIVLVKMNFHDQKDDMRYGVIKRIQHSGKGNGHYFYVSFKGNNDRDESKWQRYAVNHLFFPNKRNPVILDTKKYYVLKEEQCCSVFDEEKAIEIVVLERGIILTECDAGKQPVNKNTMCLSLFDQKDFILETTCNKLFDISYAEAIFLVAIDNPGERLRALEHREQLEYAIHAKIGDLVHIDGKEKRIVDIGPSREKTGNYFHLSYADPQHAAGIDQQVVPFNRVQFIKEASEHFKSGQEKLEKWVQGDIKDDGKNGSWPPKEIDHHDTKKEKNYRLGDMIGKRAFVPEQEI